MIKFKQNCKKVKIKRVTKEYSIVGDALEKGAEWTKTAGKKALDWTKDKGERGISWTLKAKDAVDKFVEKNLDKSTNIDPEHMDVILSNNAKENDEGTLSKYLRYRKTPLAELALSQPVVSAGIPLGYKYVVPGTTPAAVIAQAGINAAENEIGKKITKDPDFDIIKKKVGLIRKGRKWAAREVLLPLAQSLKLKGAQDHWDSVANGKKSSGLTLEDIIESEGMETAAKILSDLGGTPAGSNIYEYLKHFKNKKK